MSDLRQATLTVFRFLNSLQPSILACGSRRSACDDYCNAIANGKEVFLLVDSEAPVLEEYQQGETATWKPWAKRFVDKLRKKMDA
jgi:hypothetical protein